MAKLYFKYGTMNCGKTTILLQTIHNYESRNMKVLVLKPETDSKGGNKIVSRIGLERDVDHKIKPTEDIYEIVKKYNDLDCILVDEVQFLKKEQIDQLLKIVVLLNIPVLCYGLRTDFNTNGFEGSSRLLELAQTIEEIKTVCDCGTKATFNARMVNGKYVFEGNQVAIDGEDEITYKSLCPKCYYKIKEKSKKNS